MINSFPNISVVLASFNGVKYIEQQINSLLLQSIPPAEIIVCDDGSTDGTIEILRILESHKLITLFINNTTLGVAANFKKAVTKANSKNYIAFCDQDDIWVSNKLAENYKAMAQLEEKHSIRKPCLVYSDLSFTNQDGELLNPSFYNEMGLDKFEHCFDTSLFGSLLLGCTIFINPSMRDLFLTIPDSEYYYHDSWLALLGFGIGNVSFIKQPLVIYRLHDNNVSMPNYKPRSRVLNLMSHIFKLPFKSSYLKNELILAKDFDYKFKDILISEKKLLLANFLILNNKLHIQKKWAFEKAFKSKWIKRF